MTFFRFFSSHFFFSAVEKYYIDRVDQSDNKTVYYIN